MRALLLLASVLAASASAAPAHIITQKGGSRGELNAAIGRCRLGPKVRRSFKRALVAVTTEGLDAAELACLRADLGLLVEEDLEMKALGIAASWGLDRIDQATGLDTFFTLDSQVDTTAEVHAFVLDTGIYAEHKDFGGRVDTALSYSEVRACVPPASCLPCLLPPAAEKKTRRMHALARTRSTAPRPTARTATGTARTARAPSAARPTAPPRS